MARALAALAAAAVLLCASGALAGDRSLLQTLPAEFGAGAISCPDGYIMSQPFLAIGNRWGLTRTCISKTTNCPLGSLCGNSGSGSQCTYTLLGFRCGCQSGFQGLDSKWKKCYKPTQIADTWTPPTPCTSGQDASSGSPWVVCAADKAEAWISHNSASTTSGFKFDADAICKSLGYSYVGDYGGNCGTVCGYCTSTVGVYNVDTTKSCSSLGLKYFDKGSVIPNAVKRILGSTTMWQCIRAPTAK